ncbi:6-phospho-beta-glucosidase BglA [compost metagenome]
MTLQSNFLWGGAIAANQAEGAWNVDGKGPSIGDFLTAGSVDKKRMYTPKLQSDKNYPSHEGIRFFEKYKECFRKWVLIHFDYQYHGVEFSQMVMMNFRTKRA